MHKRTRAIGRGDRLMLREEYQRKDTKKKQKDPTAIRLERYIGENTGIFIPLSAIARLTKRKARELTSLLDEIYKKPDGISQASASNTQSSSRATTGTINVRRRVVELRRQGVGDDGDYESIYSDSQLQLPEGTPKEVIKARRNSIRSYISTNNMGKYKGKPLEEL